MYFHNSMKMIYHSNKATFNIFSVLWKLTHDFFFHIFVSHFGLLPLKQSAFRRRSGRKNSVCSIILISNLKLHLPWILENTFN